MRILKWEPNFSPLTESAIAPVWVRLEELDISKPLIDSIWVCFEEDETKVMLDGFWVHVFYDGIPSYCVSYFGIAEVSVDAENGHKSEVEELDYTVLDPHVDKVTQNVFDVLIQTDAAEAMMQQAKQLSAVTVQTDAQAEKSGKGPNHNK
ncbi:hypothetical protein LIER_09729 [Lithospermum erythrorhizon]|uniref:DUF4283 domain-containing protein n=1 Tax=Lithospermum erythrorhizon TaxID=34254 RepID=A0AAV3PJR2_LITER